MKPLYFRYVLLLQNRSYRVKIEPINYDWHHLAFVYGNNNLLIYHDGILVGSDETGQETTMESGDGKMIIARHFTNSDKNYISMHLDELMMWNEALDLDEIHDLYKVYKGYTNEETGK